MMSIAFGVGTKPFSQSCLDGPLVHDGKASSDIWEPYKQNIICEMHKYKQA